MRTSILFALIQKRIIEKRSPTIFHRRSLSKYKKEISWELSANNVNSLFGVLYVRLNLFKYSSYFFSTRRLKQRSSRFNERQIISDNVFCSISQWTNFYRSWKHLKPVELLYNIVILLCEPEKKDRALLTFFVFVLNSTSLETVTATPWSCILLIHQSNAVSSGWSPGDGEVTSQWELRHTAVM